MDGMGRWYYGGKTPNPMQVVFAGAYPECVERYYLGVPACGKTTALIQEVNRYCEQYPGSTWLLARFQETETASVLKGGFEQEVPREALRWDHEERRYYYPNGSSVYIHGLKPSDEGNRFGKFAGYNLSGVGLSQVEEIPKDFVEQLKARLRSPVPPRLLLAEGNLGITEHSEWLASLAGWDERPKISLQDRTITSGPRIVLIGNLADNEANLHPEFVAARKRDYPEGHPSYWQEVGGWFGRRSVGEPVYGPALFRPDVHLMAVDADPACPLYEAWDFGISRPAITWSQVWSGGRWRVLGEYLGHGTSLDGVIAERQRLLGMWFRDCPQVWSVGDPTGEYRKDTGLSSMKFLRDHGISIRAPRKGANHPTARGWAIQQIRELMGRRTPQGEMFGLHPRCNILAEGFLKGYVKNPHSPDLMPLKDGYFDHLQNDVEYTVQAFWGSTPSGVASTPLSTVRDMLVARDPGEPKITSRQQTRHPGGF